jgi:co-chaperonin GroES (HSP10)
MTLALPKHVYAERQAKLAMEKLQAQKEAATLASRLVLDIPEIRELPFTPDRWLMVVVQVGVKATTGGIEMPNVIEENMQWLSGLGRIVARGEAVYQGKLFADKGLTPENAPQVGDFVLFNAKTPMRIKYEGKDHIFINDDSIMARVKSDPEELKKLVRIS